jgi:hypothetical protein
MKKVFIMAMVLLTFAMSAQENRSEKNGWRNNDSDMTPEQTAALKTKKMTLLLDLNENQQKEMNKVHLKNSIKKKENLQNRKDKDELTADEKYQIKANSLDDKIALKKEVKSILNKEQYSAWEKGFAKQKKNHKTRDRQNKRCLH